MLLPFTVSIFNPAHRAEDGSWVKAAQTEVFSLYAKDHNDARDYANETLRTYKPIITYQR